MVLLDAQLPDGNAEWPALHPVYIWQFKVFLDMVTWRRYWDEPWIPPDLYAKERFTDQENMAFVTDIYSEEAEAYVQWFQKCSPNYFMMDNARKLLPPEVYPLLLPAGIRVWNADPDEPEFERFRQVTSFDFYDNNKFSDDQRVEIRKLFQGEYWSPSEMKVTAEPYCDIWEKRNNVGCMSAIFTAFENSIQRAVPYSGGFLRYRKTGLTNYAPRLSIHSDENQWRRDDT